MRQKVTMMLFVIAGAIFLFTPFAAAEDVPSEKAKQSQKTSQKKKAVKKKKKVASTTSSASNASMSVVDAKTATKVEDRDPVDTSDSFNTGDKVTVWLAVKNQGEPQNVEVVFSRDGTESGTIEVEVGKSMRWRTWVRRTVGAAGDWKADVRDSDGNSLKTLEFTVK
jgi:hypothetical protein